MHAHILCRFLYSTETKDWLLAVSLWPEPCLLHGLAMGRVNCLEGVDASVCGPCRLVMHGALELDGTFGV